ncbi:MAG TPA: hypothetical protein VLT35_00805, partial [Methanocella sp.]|nr:hypothetical protein [Methanocella sp.]
MSGVRDNGDFDRQATDWSEVAYQLNNGSGLVDLLVAPATENLTTLPFPVTNMTGIRSVSDADLVEPYLSQFDADGTRAILSIQPQDADVAGLIDLLLARYGQHKCLAGVNVDLYWKNTGTPEHASNQERDRWIGIITGHNPGLKLFLSGFEDYTFFPGDAPGLVVLYCGSGSGEDLLLARYADLARHFANVGFYTGYANSIPPIASDEKILASVPKTKYIVHVDNRFSNKKTVIFELDDVQGAWLESTSKALIDLHMSKGVPVTCGVVPYGLDTLSASDPLPAYLKALDTNRRDMVEIAQHGSSHNDTDIYEGKSLDDQRALVAVGLQVLKNIG